MATRPPPHDVTRRRPDRHGPGHSLPDAVFLRHPAPMLLVDDAARILRANEAAQARFAGDDPGRIPLLTGEALGCPAASGRDGCRPGEPCAACELRVMVLDALASGEDRGPEDLPLPFAPDADTGPLRASVTVLEGEEGRQALVTFDDAATHRRLLRELHRRDEALRRADLARRERDDRFRTLFHASRDTITVAPLDGDWKALPFVEVNDHACRVYGYTREQLLRMRPRDLHDPAAGTDYERTERELREKGHSLFERVVVTATGERLHMEVHALVVPFGGGLAVMAVSRDITGRKRAAEERENAHRASRQARTNLARLLRASVAVQAATTEREILQLVAGAVRETGWDAVAVAQIRDFRIVASAHAGMSEEEIRRMKEVRPDPGQLARLVGPERDRFRVSRSYFVPAEERADAGLAPAKRAGRRPVRDGDTWHPEDTAYVPMHGPDGELAGVINMDDPVSGQRPNEEAFRYLEFFGDLAARAIASLHLIRGLRETKEALRESDSRFQSFVNVVSDVIYRYDPARNAYDFISPSVEAQTGYPMSEVCEDPRRFVRGITHPDDLERVLDDVWSHVDLGPGAGPITMEYRIHRADGAERWVSDTMAIEFDAEGKLHRLSGVITDITQRRRTEEALRQSEKTYRTYIESAPLGIFLVDGRGRVRDANAEAGRLLQLPLATLCERRIDDLAPPELREEPETILERLLARRRFTGELPLRRGDGTVRWMSLEMVRLDDDRFLGFCTDIDNRKRAEHALRESQDRVRALSDASFEAIFFSENGVCLEQNSTAERMFGYTSEEAVGRTAAHWVAPEDLERVTRHMAAGYEGPYRITAIRKDGRRIPCEVRARSFEYRGRTVRVASVVDITERQAAERAQRESEQRFRAVFETAADAIYLKDTRLRYVLVNPVVEEMHGRSREEICGRTDAELVGEPWAAETREMDERVLRGETVEQEMLEPVHGQERLLHVVKVPMFDESGAIAGLCGVARDVTDRRRLEEELARADKLDSIGVLAGGIAHDFNNILTAILGNLSLARLSAELSPDVAELLREAEEASVRARGLTQQLLTFSKGGSPVLEILSPAEITRDVARFTLRGSNVKCEFDFAADCRTIEADAGQWNQIVSNLVLNADQAMPAGGRIVLSLRNEDVDRGSDVPLPAGPYVRLSVRDHGVGIPEDHLKRIFDPFFTTKQRGNGLGLSSVHSIVRRHHGHVAVRSDPGRGTEVIVHVPAAEGPAASREAPREAMPHGTGRILVMDDQDGVRHLAEAILSRAGYDVVAVDEGAEAVRRFGDAMRAGAPFDLLVLDLTVPGGMGGLETLERIRMLAPDVRAIVSSGYSTDPVMADHRGAGFQGRVAKPYQASDLLVAVAEVLAADAKAE